MLHGEKNDIEIGEYGLGVTRSLEAYERISGIDFANRTLTDDAREGIFKNVLEEQALIEHE